MCLTKSSNKILYNWPYLMNAKIQCWVSVFQISKLYQKAFESIPLWKNIDWVAQNEKWKKYPWSFEKVYPNYETFRWNIFIRQILKSGGGTSYPNHFCSVGVTPKKYCPKFLGSKLFTYVLSSSQISEECCVLICKVISSS